MMPPCNVVSDGCHTDAAALTVICLNITLSPQADIRFQINLKTYTDCECTSGRETNERKKIKSKT